jgi:hypothetical protein
MCGGKAVWLMAIGGNDDDSTLEGRILALVDGFSDAPDSLTEAAYAYRLGCIRGVMKLVSVLREEAMLMRNRAANANAGGRE